MLWTSMVESFKNRLMGKWSLKLDSYSEMSIIFCENLRDYVVQECFKLIRDKNEKTRVTCHRRNDCCNWRIHASPLLDGVTFKIKTLNETHSWMRDSNSVEATLICLAKHLENEFKANLQMQIIPLQETISTKFQLLVY